MAVLSTEQQKDFGDIKKIQSGIKKLTGLADKFGIGGDFSTVSSALSTIAGPLNAAYQIGTFGGSGNDYKEAAKIVSAGLSLFPPTMPIGLALGAATGLIKNRPNWPTMEVGGTNELTWGDGGWQGLEPGYFSAPSGGQPSETGEFWRPNAFENLQQQNTNNLRGAVDPKDISVNSYGVPTDSFLSTVNNLRAPWVAHMPQGMAEKLASPLGDIQKATLEQFNKEFLPYYNTLTPEQQAQITAKPFLLPQDFNAEIKKGNELGAGARLTQFGNTLYDRMWDEMGSRLNNPNIRQSAGLGTANPFSPSWAQNIGENASEATTQPNTATTQVGANNMGTLSKNEFWDKWKNDSVWREDQKAKLSAQGWKQGQPVYPAYKALQPTPDGGESTGAEAPPPLPSDGSSTTGVNNQAGQTGDFMDDYWSALQKQANLTGKAARGAAQQYDINDPTSYVGGLPKSVPISFGGAPITSVVPYHKTKYASIGDREDALYRNAASGTIPYKGMLDTPMSYGTYTDPETGLEMTAPMPIGLAGRGGFEQYKLGRSNRDALMDLEMAKRRLESGEPDALDWIMRGIGTAGGLVGPALNIGQEFGWWGDEGDDMAWADEFDWGIDDPFADDFVDIYNPGFDPGFDTDVYNDLTYDIKLDDFFDDSLLDDMFGMYE